MNTVKPIPFTTPDGVNRELRFALGARKFFVDYFGMGMQEAIQKYDVGAYPGILFGLLHDKDGDPPQGITVNQLAQSLSPEDSAEIYAYIMSAATQGKQSKNDIEPLIRKAMDKAIQENLRRITGSISGVSVLESLDLPTNNSGGDTSNAKSQPESSDGKSESADGNSSLVQ